MCSRWTTAFHLAGRRRDRARPLAGPSLPTQVNRRAFPTAMPLTSPASPTPSRPIEVPPGGAEGMINTLGGRGGGHGLYMLKGKPVFVYNFFDLERFRWEGPAALTPGKHTIAFDFK